MKYARFRSGKGIFYGIAETDDAVIHALEGNFYYPTEYSGMSFRMKDVRLLAPCEPSKVVAVGLNYIDHIKELGIAQPQNPVLFIKLPHTVIGPDDPIIIPEGATRVDYEAELAIVIKEYCQKVSVDEAGRYILGATCLNDVTERDIQKLDGQWTRCKNFDTFCPVGPWIVDGIDYDNLQIELRHNGIVKQHSSTSNLLWDIRQLVSFVSQVIPLYPGDIVTSGTPYGVSPVKSGDIVEVCIENIGTLKNPVL